jgi:hypothetical protein
VVTAVLGSGVTALATAAGPAQAADAAAPIVYSIYAHQPDAPFNELASRLLSGAAQHAHLLPMETIDIAAPPAPAKQAVEAIALAKDRVRKLRFDEAVHPLNEAADTVVATGGAGVSTDLLSDLYLYRGMTIARADWKPERSVDQATQARAYADYVRAVILTPTRALNPRETPPQVMDDWARALADVHGRARGVLTVRGPADATVAFDGGAALSIGGGGAIFKDVVYGEHLVHVEQVGYAPWGAVVALDRPAQEVAVPSRPSLVIDDQVAGAHARRMGARYALVGEVQLGAPSLQLEIRLIDATGIKHDAAVVPLPVEAGTVDATVLRLCEEARHIDHLGLGPSSGNDAPAGGAAAASTAINEPLAPPRPGAPVLVAPLPAASPRLADDPAGWARHHWPLVIAVGGVLTTALVLSIAVAANR